jgi:hypothetical protein
MIEILEKGRECMAAKKKAMTGKRTYETPEELKVACDKYFEKVDKDGEVPTESGLALHLGISVVTLRHWYDGDYSTDLMETIRDAYNEMTVRYTQMLLTGNKNMTPFVIFMLKQVRFAGYQDKVEAKTDIAVNVKMGSGMDESDFK